MIKLTKIITAAVAIATGSLSSLVYAQDFDNRPNIYGGAVHYFFDRRWNQDDEFGWLIGGEVPINERMGLALEHYNLESGSELGFGDSDYQYTRIGGNYLLNPDGNWQPYLSAGLSYADLQNSAPVAGNAVDDLGYDFGVGVKNIPDR